MRFNIYVSTIVLLSYLGSAINLDQEADNFAQSYEEECDYEFAQSFGCPAVASSGAKEAAKASTVAAKTAAT